MKLTREHKMKEERLVLQKRIVDDGYRNFSIRIKSETVNKLDELSRATNISRNEIIGRLLEFAIDHCDIE